MHWWAQNTLISAVQKVQYFKTFKEKEVWHTKNYLCSRSQNRDKVNCSSIYSNTQCGTYSQTLKYTVHYIAGVHYIPRGELDATWASRVVIMCTSSQARVPEVISSHTILSYYSGFHWTKPSPIFYSCPPNWSTDIFLGACWPVKHRQWTLVSLEEIKDMLVMGNLYTDPKHRKRPLCIIISSLNM